MPPGYQLSPPLITEDEDGNEFPNATFDPDYVLGSDDWEVVSYNPTIVNLVDQVQYSYVPIDFNDAEFFTPVGWTVSYYPEIKLWGSFHSYVPYRYFNTHSNIYSLTHANDNQANEYIWEHGDGNFGSLYNEPNIYPFVFEFINNLLAAEDTLSYSLSYTADTIKNDGHILEAGFSSVIFYNSMQMSNNIPLEYLVTTRKIGNAWKINKFRDMSRLLDYTTDYYTNGLTNVVGELTDSVSSTGHIPMFYVDGMHEIQNLDYLNLDKPWNLQKKFVDKWIGIRLICDNTRNNLVNLYSAAVEARKYNR